MWNTPGLPDFSKNNIILGVRFIERFRSETIYLRYGEQPGVQITKSFRISIIHSRRQINIAHKWDRTVNLVTVLTFLRTFLCSSPLFRYLSSSYLSPALFFYLFSTSRTVDKLTSATDRPSVNKLVIRALLLLLTIFR